MICTNCFEAETETVLHTIEDIGAVECQKCPVCEDIVFTHEQSLVVDRLRRGLTKGAEETK